MVRRTLLVFRSILHTMLWNTLWPVVCYFPSLESLPFVYDTWDSDEAEWRNFLTRPTLSLPPSVRLGSSEDSTPLPQLPDPLAPLTSSVLSRGSLLSRCFSLLRLLYVPLGGPGRGWSVGHLTISPVLLREPPEYFLVDFPNLPCQRGMSRFLWRIKWVFGLPWEY